MRIIQLKDIQPEIKSMWEIYMQESWADYEKATHFIQEADDGTVSGGFAVYWDKSDGIEGHYISGWSIRKNMDSVIDVIKHVADMLGNVYIKTEKRNVKIIGYKLGKLVKNVGRFSYFIVRGE